MNITAQLKENADTAYADFQAKLTPGVPRERIIGVRIPVLRKLAKSELKSGQAMNFINSLPHEYYDENILHSIILSGINDFDLCLREVELFLPHIDNWAVCDTLSPVVFKRNKDAVMRRIPEWIDSGHNYTCRFGIKCIMTWFLDDDFKEEYLALAADVHSDDYYVRMMQAWLFATALSKKWNETITYIENQRLDYRVHNKTIQKARESYRITPEQKEYLAGLKIRNNVG